MPFEGYPAGPVRWVPLPEPFLQDVLPHVDDLYLLHVLLFAFWYLSWREGRPRYVPEPAFRRLLEWPVWQALGEGAEARLRQSLERAVAEGYLLRGEARDAHGQPVALYFLPSPKGRAAWEALRLGRWRPQPDPDEPVAIDVARPNIFRLYETHIGPLTPLIAERLEQAARTYPHEWIEEAFRLAVERNVRHWRYIEAILRRWYEEGRDDRTPGRRAEASPEKFRDSPYAALYRGE